LGELFAALRARQDSDPSWQDIVYFLQEFCTLARHLQPQQVSTSTLRATIFPAASEIVVAHFLLLCPATLWLPARPFRF
jgi:hypothetical protein